MPKVNRRFAFLVLIYNHEEYIIEHLESIKYLIENYGKDTAFDIIINDDCSRDDSKLLVDYWLSCNSIFFRNIIKIYNEKNLGTCKSIINMLNSMHNDIDACKMTAADDVYSFENIVQFAFDYSSHSIVSGIPLHFSSNELYLDSREFYGMVSSQYCYGKNELEKRFKYLSVNNAPNIIYNKELLISRTVINFLKDYDVVEDWPIQLAISKCALKPSFELINKVFVYYRRTPGSAYIIANKRFLNDKINIYNYLIKNSPNLFEKIILRNRLWLFRKGNRIFNKFLNFAFYIFTLKSILNSKKIYSFKKGFCPELMLHNAHLRTIKTRAAKYIEVKDSIS